MAVCLGSAGTYLRDGSRSKVSLSLAGQLQSGWGSKVLDGEASSLDARSDLYTYCLPLFVSNLRFSGLEQGDSYEIHCYLDT